MTGAEHFIAADRELARIENDQGEDEALQDAAHRMEILARAQVHATLALAAATATVLTGIAAGDQTNGWREAIK